MDCATGTHVVGRRQVMMEFVCCNIYIILPGRGRLGMFVLQQGCWNNQGLVDTALVCVRLSASNTGILAPTALAG